MVWGTGLGTYKSLLQENLQADGQMNAGSPFAPSGGCGVTKSTSATAEGVGLNVQVKNTRLPLFAPVFRPVFLPLLLHWQAGSLGRPEILSPRR
jgi:hypothetical protein